MLVGLTAGGCQAGRQAEKYEYILKIFKVLNGFGLLLCLITVQCYYSVIDAIQSQIIAYFKMCFEACKT